MQFKFSKTKKTVKKRDIYVRADMYWQITVGIVCILALVAASFGYRVFRETNKETYLTNPNTEVKRIIDRNRITRALEYFETRKAKSAEIRSNPPVIVDPSV